MTRPGRRGAWSSTGLTRRRSSRWRATRCFAGGWPGSTPRRGGRSAASSASAPSSSPTRWSSSSSGVPIRASATGIPRPARQAGDMWNWHDGKVALEYLFFTGRVVSAGRVNFERLYDLPERVLPDEVLAAADARSRRGPAPSSSGSRRRRSGSPPSPTWATTSACPARTPKRGWPSWPPRASSSKWRWRGGALRRTCGRTPAGRAGSRRGRSSRRLTRSCGFASAPSGSSAFATGSRSTCPPPSGSTATTCSRSCSATRWWAASTSSQTARTAPCWSRRAFAEEGVDTAHVAAELAAELRLTAAWLGLSDVVVRRRGDLAPALQRAIGSS